MTPAVLVCLLALALAVPGAARAADADAARRQAAAWTLLETYDLEGARAALADRSLFPAPDPGSRLLEARLAFFEGRYREARGLLEGLPPGFLPGGHEFPRLVADTAEEAARLTPYRGDHFTVSLDERRDWVLAGRALEALETARRRLGAVFGLEPGEPLRVEIYPDAESFQKVSSLQVRDIETSGAVGICKFNKIMMLSPRALAHGYRWMDTLTHEYLHWLVVRLTNNKAPIWVHEGVAKVFESRWKTDSGPILWPSGESLLAEGLEKGDLIAFEDMDPSLVRLDSAREVDLAFAECASAVEYILGQVGETGLVAFLKRIGEMGHGETSRALAEALGTGYEAFQEGWRSHLASRGLRKIEHLRVEGLRLAGTLGEEESLMLEVQSQAALNHLRLGDTLRRGGRPKPALVEYRKAWGESPGSPYIINKVAIAAILLEDWATADEYLGRALEMAPDYPLTWQNLGDAALGRGKAAEAALRYDEHNEINPYNPRVWQSLAAALQAAGEGERASLASATASRLEKAH